MYNAIHVKTKCVHDKNDLAIDSNTGQHFKFLQFFLCHLARKSKFILWTDGKVWRCLWKNLALYVTIFSKKDFFFKLFKEEKGTGIERYKIQPGTNAPLGKKRFLELISLVSFNQLFIGAIAQYIFFHIHVYVNNLTNEDILVLPSL